MESQQTRSWKTARYKVRVRIKCKMPNAEFLETYSLFRQFKIEIPPRLDDILKPPINMECQSNSCKDGKTRTFKMINEYYDTPAFGFDVNKRSLLYTYTKEGYISSGSGDFTRVTKESIDAQQMINSKGAIVLAVYKCTSCDNFRRVFILRFSPNLGYIQKIGQYPPWDIIIDKNLEEIFADSSDIYKKGLICESQGYGIGSYAYYRRIVEKIIDDLLISIEDLIEKNEDKNIYRETIKQVKREKDATEKIKLVKDLLPASLKPGDWNPLSILYSELSAGLHGETDEECLEKSVLLRSALIFLLKKVKEERETVIKFTETMKKLLEPKTKNK